ncbi:hypothetical protein ASD54_04725 [Rhizobium sp. Root149]|nr:hypothetical protein ASD54_04725 [Rhizobium sp. Root149]
MAPTTLGKSASRTSFVASSRSVLYALGSVATVATLVLPTGHLSAAHPGSDVTASSMAGHKSYGNVVLHAAFNDAVTEMSSFSVLPDGWDGVGSISPSKDAINSALLFLASLPFDTPVPEASAAADGMVSWFWDTPSIYSSVSFSDPLKFVFFAKNKETGAKVKGQSLIKDGIPQELLDVINAA